MTALLADIASGESGTADVMFLAAFIVAVVAFVAAVAGQNWRFVPYGALVAASVGLLGFGLLML